MLITEGSKLGSFWALARGNPVVSFNLIAFWPLVLRLQRAGDHDPQENWCRDSVGGQHRKARDRHRGCSDHLGGEPLPIEARRQPHLHRRCLPVLDYRRPREEEVRHASSLLCPPPLSLNTLGAAQPKSGILRVGTARARESDVPFIFLSESSQVRHDFKTVVSNSV